MQTLDEAINKRIFTPEKTLEAAQEYVEKRIKQLEIQISPENWEITNNIIRARISELNNVQLIIGKTELGDKKDE